MGVPAAWLSRRLSPHAARPVSLNLDEIDQIASILQHGRAALLPATVGKRLRVILGGQWTGHTLRHRFATMAYRAQRDLLTVQRLLGHAKPETTARYAEPPAEAAMAAVMGAAA